MRTNGRTVSALIVALTAGGTLLIKGPATAPAPAPKAERADLPAYLADGSTFTPRLFLKAGTAIGVAGTRLVMLTGGTVRELRPAAPLAGNPDYDDFTIDGDDVVWAESSDTAPLRIWTLDVRSGQAPRPVTTDTGNAVFYGNQQDLSLHGGRVYWAATAEDDVDVTEIRSIPLAGGGGPVEVRRVPGQWGLTAWPWLTDSPGGPSPTTHLRNLDTGQVVTVPTGGGEATECSPRWCRVMISDSEGLIRIDMMHPDGTARRRIAGPDLAAAVGDVALLDRFDVLSQNTPDSDLTGMAALLVYDLSTNTTLTLTRVATNAFARAGVLWWSTGTAEAARWHSLDLRTM
ncbi:hypothetical protein [Actinoplanes sp. HUAS TT8]|uniref:hypothetical protein n=1 Tax=Actinoplanes sp. HUAS TT8 TaxID=3447453 RepID=UPI003F523FA5